MGQIKGHGSAIEWSLTRSGHEAIVLLVQAPDGTLYEKTFRGQQNPTFRVNDLKGALLDGVYTYELRVIPSVPDTVKSALNAARAAGDDAKIKELMKANGLASAVVQSGAFGMVNGAFLDPAAKEPTAKDDSVARASRPAAVTTTARTPDRVAAEYVIADNLIVQGSTCTGFDCIDGETFDFDTLRLKENNLRIHFLDTSNIAGYPANDWRISANDSTSGGLNRLYVEDVSAARIPFSIEAAAPANAIYVDSTGNVGLQTSTPVLDLSLATTDSPAIRLEQTNAGGWTAQIWDIAANESNFFVRDTTGGSKLPFRIRPGAPTSSLDIAGDGDIGMSVSTPNANTRLDVADTTQVKARIAFTGQEFYAAGNSSTDGVALLLGANRTGNRQLWIADTASLAQNTGNTVIRLFPSNSVSDISAIATNGTTTKPLSLNVNGGNVGVGTSSPLSKLHVAGDVRVSGGSFIDDGVTLTAPDYVFEDSYALMPVPELATFVKENKHLPGVPSAKDIARNGLNVSKFQMSLLEKIEELTLYIAAQEERIAKLEAAIANR